MKNIFDESTRTEFIARINKLDANSAAQWGQMTVYQMIRHCIMWEDMIQGKTLYKQAFMGKIFGKIALKGMLGEEPVKRNMPTVPSFKMTGSGDVEAAKKEWISLLERYKARTPAGFLHPFFGRLTAEQAGQMDYKHIDHHLQQFGV